MRSFLFATLSIFAATSAAAATWHVSPSGSDSAAGTADAPWKTIQHAADLVQPGDTVVVDPGVYTGFTVSASGTAAQPIAFVASGTVAIDGASTSNQDAIEIDGGSYVTIQGFTITSAKRAGISALNCDHITIRDNTADQNGKWGIFSGFCDDLTIEHNVASRSGTQHGIYASNSADNPIIRGNTIWGNAMCGIHVNGDISQGGDGVISNALIEDNVIYDNGKLGGSAINCDGVNNSIIRNNVLDSNHASGISLYQIDGGLPSTGDIVVNNTIRMASDARFALNIQNGAANTTIYNNILLDPTAGKGAIDISSDSLPGLVSDHNAGTDAWSIDGNVTTLAAWRAKTGTDAASFVASDAQLFAPGALTLVAGSPAIDAGEATDAPDVDILGTARPQGAAIDLGAYEWCDGACTDGAGSGSGSGGGAGSGSGSGGGGTGGGSGSGIGTGSGTGTGGGSGTGTGTGSGTGGDGASPMHAGCAAGGGSGSLVAFALLALACVRRRGA